MTNGRRRGRGIGGDQQEISPFVTDKPIAETIPRRGRDGYLRTQNVQISQGLLQLFEHTLKFPDAFPADDTFLAHSADGLLAWLPAGAITGSVQWSQIINKPSTLAGYGILDAYTQLQIQAIMNAVDFSDTGFGTPIQGVAARSQLPVQIAYEDEVNVFSEANTFSSTLGVTGILSPASSIILTNASGSSIYRSVNDQYTAISGGTGGTVGANIVLYGGTQVTVANDINFRAGVATTLKYDHSLPRWTFTPAVYMSNILVVTGATYLQSTLGVTGVITQVASRPITLGATSGWIKIKGNASGWATGTKFLGSADTDLGGFGAYGNVDALNYFYVGTYAAELAKWASSMMTVLTPANFDAAVTMDTTLGVTGATTLSSDVFINGARDSGSILHVARGLVGGAWTANARTVAVFEGSNAGGATITIAGKAAGLSGIFFGNEDAEASGQFRHNNATSSFELYVGGNIRLTVAPALITLTPAVTMSSTLGVTGDVTIGSLGAFDSADTPTDRQLLLYNNSVSKWQAEDIQLAWGNSDVKAAVLADNTAVAYILEDPGAGADSPVGAPDVPSAPTLYGAHESITLEVVGYSRPADFRYFEWRYSEDNFVADDHALATTTSDKIVHARLDNTTTYYYKVRATDRAANSSSYSGVSNTTPVANGSQAFGVILAAEIGVTNLAAIQADIGIITAGQMRDITNVYGINLGGAGGIPGTWNAGVNFENTAVDGMDRYVNFYEGASDGLDFFIKHEHFDLMHDGTARFRGFLDLTALGAVYGLSDQWAVFRAPDLTHGMTDVVPTDVALDVLLQSTTQGGVTVRGLTGTGSDTVIPLVLFGVSGRASPVTPSVHIYGRKKNGTTTQALADDEPILRVSSIALTSDIAFVVFPKRADFPAEMSCTGEQTFSSTGTQNNVALSSSVSVFNHTGGSATTITGFSGGYQGRLVYVVSAGAALTIAENSGSSSLGNRIYTGAGANVVFSTQGGFFMRYDGTYWRILALSN